MWIGSLMASVCTTVFSISWFVWPFVFVFSPAWGIRDWVYDETCSAKPLLLAGLSLMIRRPVGVFGIRGVIRG